MENDLDNRVLFISDDVIVVNKIAGEAMEGAVRGMVDVPALLYERFGLKDKGEDFVPVAVHRLDVPVSGCALFARNTGAAGFLGKAFSRTTDQGGRAEKVYWAVVELSPSFSGLPAAGELVHWIQSDMKKNKSTACAAANPCGKEAVLRYRILGKGKNYGFMELDLITGRHHQIRAQLAALNIHIKGDIKYGAKRTEKDGGIRLHARSLCFPDPAAPEHRVRITADPPRMDNLWKDFAAGA